MDEYWKPSLWLDAVEGENDDAEVREKVGVLASLYTSRRHREDTLGFLTLMSLKSFRWCPYLTSCGSFSPFKFARELI